VEEWGGGYSRTRLLAPTRAARPLLGDYASSCGSASPASATGTIPMALSEAIIATYKTIHIARSLVHTVRQLRSPCRSCRRGAQIPKVLAFRQRKRAPRYPQTAASRLPLSRDACEQLLLDPFVGPLCRARDQSVNDAGVCGSLLGLARLLVAILGARFS
jgi:hypothetical protein